MVVKEDNILNITFINPTLSMTTDPPATEVVTVPSFFYIAVVFLVVAFVIVVVTITVIGLLTWMSKMKAQIKNKVQAQLESQRSSRKNSVVLNNNRDKQKSTSSGNERQILRRTQSTIGFPTREKLKRIRSRKSTSTAAETEGNTLTSSAAGARAEANDRGASVQPSSAIARARSLPNLTILEAQTSEGFFMGERHQRNLRFHTTVTMLNTERMSLNKWARHHIKANRQLETVRTIHDLATRRRNYGANESKQSSSLNKESHNELARYAVRSLAASAKTPEPEKGPRTKL